eukprot:CAMPEP_0183384616 /NCGR_PEP_ID=MMETSP0370-20130417/712_1 /TAXON_ID=268820 /ORGANISM="Peridinium aciculiferum, Strain PAER-2" /LENGTH=33 /DNA_ID= /DNA_START= /DNA_END= /DNA_ORIENTATION=
MTFAMSMTPVRVGRTLTTLETAATHLDTTPVSL